MNKEHKDIRRKGRIYQTGIYLGKFFRMFINQSDWKVMPMAAIIAGLVGMVMHATLFKYMEGTLMGSFALSCICVWNGFFNSIQVVCRERAIIKREHRSGLHITSYILAHAIYQAFLCLLQTIITLFILQKMGVLFPASGIVFSNIYIDLGVTVFLSIFAADMLSLLISSFVRNTTTAMTVMPFLLIFQLVFSGGFFTLPESVKPLTNITITKWSLTAACAQGRYNDLPMVSIWNSMKKMSNATVTTGEIKQIMMSSSDISSDPDMLIVMASLPDDKVVTFGDLISQIEQQPGAREALMKRSGELNQEEKYASTRENVTSCWSTLAIHILIYMGAAMISLEFIDKDKR